MTRLSRLLHHLETTGFGAFLLGMTVPAAILVTLWVTK
jgi:hypothetical protein